VEAVSGTCLVFGIILFAGSLIVPAWPIADKAEANTVQRRRNNYPMLAPLLSCENKKGGEHHESRFENGEEVDRFKSTIEA
jgi:hypothetical protein